LSVPRHFARRRFGQHFLVDREIVERIVSAVNPCKGDEMLEIGPGKGALTAPLLDRSVRLRAIEIDRDLVASLKLRFPVGEFELFEADALRFDYARLPERLRVVGNLPYNISTPLLFHLCSYAERFVDLHFMLQKEVVERMAAGPSTPAYGRLSIMLQHRFRVELLFVVPPAAFKPMPKVHSALVRLIPRAAGERAEVEEIALRRVVTAAFSHRRKTLSNALSGLLSEARLLALGVDPRLRAENLSLADYVTLARYISDNQAPDVPKTRGRWHN
jgi:16S rRNA (adenine1518-N6/adenine1519-N6)-dimethyltransferase